MENVMKRIIATTLLACTLAATADAQAPDFTPQTPLIRALLHNDAAAAKRLLEQGADPNDGQFFGMTPIVLAIARQDLALVRLMAANGADLSVRDRSGSTALMWAAFSETGDAAVVEELLRLGADPGATNQAGETALDWALRRGDTPAVAALRKAGVSETATMKASIEKSIALLQTSSAQFTKMSGCSSCHHQLLPMIALGVARTRGLRIDEPAASHQVDVTVGVLKRVYEQARANRDRLPDPPISVSYTLLGLAAESYKPDEITDAMVHVIGAWQSDGGAFHPLPSMRPPIESNSITATALSLRAIQLYGADEHERIARATAWLRTAIPRTTEERAMQLLGLAWAKAPADDIRKSAK